MSYSIAINGHEQQIMECHNKENFTKAVEMFSLFDDSRINSIETRKALIKIDPKFKIVFYLGGVHYCDWDSYMFACYLKNEVLIIALSYDQNSDTFNLRPNEEYCCGEMAMIITPFSAICDHYNPKNDAERRILELFVNAGGYNLEQKDGFGKEMISPTLKVLIKTMEKSDKITLDFSVTDSLGKKEKLVKLYLRLNYLNRILDSDENLNTEDVRKFVRKTLCLLYLIDDIEEKFIIKIECLLLNFLNLRVEVHEDLFNETEAENIYNVIISGKIKLSEEEENKILASKRELPERFNLTNHKSNEE